MPSLRAGAVINTSALCVFFFFFYFVSLLMKLLLLLGKRGGDARRGITPFPICFPPKKTGKYPWRRNWGAAFPVRVLALWVPEAAQPQASPQHLLAPSVGGFQRAARALINYPCSAHMQTETRGSILQMGTCLYEEAGRVTPTGG